MAPELVIDSKCIQFKLSDILTQLKLITEDLDMIK